MIKTLIIRLIMIAMMFAGSLLLGINTLKEAIGFLLFILALAFSSYARDDD